jgi:hypothetical protein
MIFKAWPRGLIGRVMLVPLGAIVLEFAASTFVYENAELLRADEDEARLLVDRLVIAERLLKGATAERRGEILEALSTPPCRSIGPRRPRRARRPPASRLAGSPTSCARGRS